MRTASSSFGTGFTSAAALLYKATGRRLTCVFVDHGLLRKGESDAILREEILSLSGLGRQVSQYFTVLTGNPGGKGLESMIIDLTKEHEKA